MTRFSPADRRRSLAALRRPLLLTRLGMIAERLVASLWPLFSLCLAVLALLMLGVQDLVAIELVWGGAVASVLGAGAALWFALKRFRLPSRTEAMDRLDRTLTGHPIRALRDDMATGTDDAATAAVWRAHQARMAARTAGARAVAPDVNTAPRDPYALRYAAMLVFAVALLFGSIWRVGSVAEMAPGGGDALASGPVWEGWVEPPRYTGMPTLYLGDQPAGPLDVPLGSLVTVRFYGEVGALTLAETVSARVGEVPPASAPAQDFIVRQSGTLEITGPAGRQWDVVMRPDSPPVIAPVDGMETSALGEVTLPYAASDDYGIASGEARFTLDLAAADRRYGLSVDPEPRPDLIVPLPIPFSGARTDFTENLIDDFSKHPWANLPVKLELSALDAAEQEGLSEPEEMILPGRRFFDPLAAAIIEMRRDILWSRENTARAAQILRTAAHRPDDIFRSETLALKTRRLIERMEVLARFEYPDETRDALAEDLWGLAITLEEGDLQSARERMERARQRLEEAMRNGASDEEIAELMRELRQATEDYLDEMRRQAMREGQQDQNGEPQPMDPNALQMTQDDIQRMMDRIQELMEQGRMAEAEQALRELQEMLENLQMAQPQPGGGQSEGEQAMEGLAETLREQQGLSDEAFRDLQDQFGDQQGQPQGEGQQQGQGQGQQQGQGQGQGQNEGQARNGQGGDAQSLEEGLAERQRNLRNELSRQQRGLPGAGTPEGDAARDALDRAGRAMENAEEQLRSDDYAGAIDSQSQAMEALREGMRNLGEAMQQQAQQGQQGQGMSEGDQRAEGRDPLGREQGNNGNFGSEGEIPGGDDVYRRAQELLDEIRRRSAEADRPDEERDYLNRLLERF